MGSSIFQFLPSIQEIDAFLLDQGKPSGRKVRNLVQNALVQLRHQIANKTLEPDLLDSPSRESFLQWILENLKDYAPVQKVINATGVVVHTNLGRAPLPKDLFENLLPRLCSYSNLEFELETGKRGSRDSVLRNLLRNLSGCLLYTSPSPYCGKRGDCFKRRIGRNWGFFPYSGHHARVRSNAG